MRFNFIQYLKPISISLSPNTEKDDVVLALKLILKPWVWKKGGAIEEFENKFSEFSGLKHAVSFNSGRTALMAILESLELEKGSEVLLQAFTCNAAVNPIIWSELKPIYIDCDEETFNIDEEDLKKKIDRKSRVVIAQHTFGHPANLEKLEKICKENDLLLIEDCAHSLGAEYAGRKVGTFGIAAFFSFSRDKIISSVYGGMAATNDEAIYERIRKFRDKINYPSYFWVLQQLLHPVLMNYIVLPTYGIFGKYLLPFLQWLRLLSKAVHWKEKKAMKPSYFPKKLPNALAVLALKQMGKIAKFNEHRRNITTLYRRELSNSVFSLPLEKTPAKSVFLRFTIRHPKAHSIIRKAWSKNILIGDWYKSPIAPEDTDLTKMRYKIGSCPKAESLAKTTFNLPTGPNISEENANKIIEFLKTYGN